VGAACPAGYTDATPPNGGAASIAYVGRYCLSPDAQGGAELTFAEVATRAEEPAAVRRMFELAAARLSAVGAQTGGAFGPGEPARAGDVEGSTARLEFDPPAARVKLRAWLVPAGGQSLFALALTMPEHAAATRTTTEGWLASERLAVSYDPAVVTAQRRRQVTTSVLMPALITALLGAMTGVYFRGRR
jgi:hypothetical protein